MHQTRESITTGGNCGISRDFDHESPYVRGQEFESSAEFYLQNSNDMSISNFQHQNFGETTNP